MKKNISPESKLHPSPQFQQSNHQQNLIITPPINLAQENLFISEADEDLNKTTEKIKSDRNIDQSRATHKTNNLQKDNLPNSIKTDDQETRKIIESSSNIKDPQGKFQTASNFNMSTLLKISNENQETVKLQRRCSASENLTSVLLLNSKGEKTYEGFLKNGLKHGFGSEYKRVTINGVEEEYQFYQGNWSKGFKHGSGGKFNIFQTEKSAYLHIKDCEIELDIINYGECDISIDPFGTTLYKGQFSKDYKLEGYGSLFSLVDGKVLYSGNFKDNELALKNKTTVNNQVIDALSRCRRTTFPQPELKLILDESN